MIPGVRRLAVTAVMSLMAMTASAGLANAATLAPSFSHFGISTPDLPRSGDFDGDGRMDQLVLIAEPDTGRVAVHVELNTVHGIKDVRVTSFDADASTSPDLRIVAAGHYTGDCGSFAVDCNTNVQASHDSLMIGLAGGASLLVHWQDGAFQQDFVRSDESMMAHALAALYAANP